MNAKSFSKPEYIWYGVAIVLCAAIPNVMTGVESISSVTRLLGNLATFFLYISLLASALNANFKTYPGRMFLTKYRKANGVTAFIFAAAHWFFGFFKSIGGIEAFNASDPFFQQTISAGMIAFYILVALAATSTMFAMKKLGKYWKLIHRLVYISGVLVLAHIVMIRVYYSRLTDATSLATFLLFAILILLQLVRFAKFVSKFAATKVKTSNQTTP